ncbi:ricin-type beta-trefoil lectin domain protein, partial [Micromonospora sp. 067-2]|uniref:ricin-type beta-trefoil lectin domain protein n=1 Tax=Micromonospora sp. 067-2 TaxID=2789270 RepID=UPI00397A24C2
LEAGISEVNIGPDGAIYVGGLGAGGNWGQDGKLTYGLQKLTPNSTTTFEMQAMRATAGGFEVEYTQPVSADTAANLAAHYKVKQWRYVPTASYGGPKVDEETLTVTSATLSADRKKVTLAVDGRKAGRVVYLRSPRPFTSESGQSLWSTEAWYTLNAIPGSTPPPTSGAITGIGGKCVDVSNSGTADGTKIQLWTCNGTGAQNWSRVGDTYRALGKCLDVDNGGTANGTKVQLWTCNGSGAQIWQPQANGSILNPQSGKVLEAAGAGTANGTQIQLGTYAGGAHQKWVISG